MYHYTYKLTSIETGEYYFGSRSSKVHPSLDSYMGSMVTWKPDKTKLIKEIINLSYSSREDCMIEERNLIIQHIEDNSNKNFQIPGINFHSVNLGVYIDKNGKVLRLNKDDILIIEKDLKPLWLNKKHTDESKMKMSESAKTRKITNENEKIRRKKIKLSMKGKPMSESAKLKLSEQRIGNKNPYIIFLSKNNLTHHASKKVGQYDKNENFIKFWVNASIASKELNLSYKSINNCLNNKIKSSGGYIWKYE